MRFANLLMITFLATLLFFCDKATRQDTCPKIKWDSRSFRKLDELSMKDLLIGKNWIYQYSMNEDSCFLTKGDRCFPIKYVFRGCPSDSLPEILNTRSLDLFSAVCYQTYGDSIQDNGTNLIENNFAFIRKFDDLGIFNIAYYGVYTKGEIYITKVNTDTLVIRDAYHFVKNDRSSIMSEHIYLGRRLQAFAAVGSASEWRNAQPIDMKLVKKRGEKSSTSTFLTGQKKTAIFKKFPAEGYCGRYTIFFHPNSNSRRIEYAGELVVFNDETPWRYDNTTDIFVEMLIVSEGIELFGDLHVGLTKQRFVERLGQPHIEMGNVMIFKGNGNMYVGCVHSRGKVEEIRVGMYNETLSDDEIVEFIRHSFD